MLELEGTWEEIGAHAAELAGRRVRVTVLDTPENTQQGAPMSPAERFAAAIHELEFSDQDMPLTPGGNSVALVREARAGAMWGDDANVLPQNAPQGRNLHGHERDPELVARVKSMRGKFAPPGGELASEALHRGRQADKQKEEEPLQRYRP